MLAARGVPFRLRVICSAFPEWDDVPVERIRWRPETADRDLAAADVAIVPRSTSAWDRAKTALKAVEAMAAGLPVVASPVGPLTQAVTPGETGFLARTSPDWERALEVLLSDAVLRGRMGEAGRRRALTDYDDEVVAARLRDVLAPLVTSAKSAK